MTPELSEFEHWKQLWQGGQWPDHTRCIAMDRRGCAYLAWLEERSKRLRVFELIFEELARRGVPGVPGIAVEVPE